MDEEEIRIIIIIITIIIIKMIIINIMVKVEDAEGITAIITKTKKVRLRPRQLTCRLEITITFSVTKLRKTNLLVVSLPQWQK